MEILALVLFAAVIISVIVYYSVNGKTNYSKSPQDQIAKRETYTIIDTISLGGLLYGFGEKISIPLLAKCIVTEHEFIFINNPNKEFGRISRDSITDILFEDKSTVTERVTATRLLTIGVFALAAKKKEVNSDYFLTIKWKSNNFEEDAMFQINGVMAKVDGPKAISSLKRYIIHKEDDTIKKCPFCAETIKKEAIICRFCSKDLV